MAILKLQLSRRRSAEKIRALGSVEHLNGRREFASSLKLQPDIDARQQMSISHRLELQRIRKRQYQMTCSHSKLIALQSTLAGFISLSTCQDTVDNFL